MRKVWIVSGTLLTVLFLTVALQAQEAPPAVAPKSPRAVEVIREGPEIDEEPKINWALPAAVVETVPANRAMDVDPNLAEIKVTFDRPMVLEQSWSWIVLEEYGEYPGIRGFEDPRWEKDELTCVLPVALKPDTVYAVGVNSFQHTGFLGRDRKPAVPYAIVFKTRKK